MVLIIIACDVDARGGGGGGGGGDIQSIGLSLNYDVGSGVIH